MAEPMRCRVCGREFCQGECGRDPNTPLRMHIALKILRAWNHGTEGYEALTVQTIWDWIDAGMKGPISWPDSPFFAEWAAKQGYSNVHGAVGFTLRMQVQNA